MHRQQTHREQFPRGRGGHRRQGRASWACAWQRAHCQWHIHTRWHPGPHRLTEEPQPIQISAEISALPALPAQTLTSSYPQPLLQTRATREPGSCWPCSVTAKVRRLKAEGPLDRGRGMPGPPRPPPRHPRVLTHPIPALRHLAEGGHPPRPGRANKGLSHQSPEGGGSASGRPAAL